MGIRNKAPASDDNITKMGFRQWLVVSATCTRCNCLLKDTRLLGFDADEAFFCGTGVQVAWIESIDGRPVGDGKIGSITTRLRTTFFDTVRGRSKRYADWITRVHVGAESRGAGAAHR